MSLYEILCVTSLASDAEIRDSYRRLARQLHPDSPAAPCDAEQRMAELNHAYMVLSNPSQRRAYDLSAQPISLDVTEVNSGSSVLAAITAVLVAFGSILFGLGIAAGAAGLSALGLLMLMGSGLAAALRFLRAIKPKR
jgi:curved DNA-binding protein CbpA